MNALTQLLQSASIWRALQSYAMAPGFKRRLESSMRNLAVSASGRQKVTPRAETDEVGIKQWRRMVFCASERLKEELRVLIIHAHPSPTSFTAAVAREAQSSIAQGGHFIESCDLYAERFDPVLPLETSRRYLEVPANRAGVERYVDSLLAADGLVFIFPVWHDGLPAILKGYFDRVFVRGVAFEMNSEGVFSPLLQRVRRLAAIALYGADRARTRVVGDLPRRFVRHNLGALIAPEGRIDYLAAYEMDRADPLRRDSFLKKVRRAFRSW